MFQLWIQERNTVKNAKSIQIIKWLNIKKLKSLHLLKEREDMTWNNLDSEGKPKLFSIKRLKPLKKLHWDWNVPCVRLEEWIWLKDARPSF